MRFAGHEARIGEWRSVYVVLVLKPKAKRKSEDLKVDVRIILKWTLQQLYLRAWSGLIAEGQGQISDCYEGGYDLL